ncbi:NB-ARC domain-containing protein [cf. Phormidesmis sp. LEGE 11477]|uniref:WD40 domain-containing protein n=1 Tax=cf. Phormidesmis sp. LEGE 11477 TaxID=1828680 RepID=UPI00187E9EA3|nr:NB-ARC domain-containing protein [cf. Phormidesmis sp. LEGE 11477]MBE9062996.1 hypothetical protein [cf. Phormidesmis sp. LEGE 11477]
MGSSKPKRNRGVILTKLGYQKLWQAQLDHEIESNEGKSYTLEQISEKTGLDNGTIRRILGRREGVDKRSITRFFKGFHLLLDNQDYIKPAAAAASSGICRRKDFQGKVDVSTVYGRTEELACLRQSVLQDRCRLIALLGMGGIGKTSLTAKLVEQVGNGFEYVIWRSLRDAMPVEMFLADVIQLISDDQSIKTDLASKPLAHLLQAFNLAIKNNRCLLVLDNFETVLHGRRRVGLYSEGCEQYGHLLRLVGETEHTSCLMITSREKPREVASLEGEQLPVRSFFLKGLKTSPGQELLALKQLSGSAQTCQALIDLYAGNPLALKVVSTTIQDLFDGDIDHFLQQETVIFGDIRDLLDRQFDRLTDLEKSLMYWLAINREPVSLSDLREDMVIKTPIQDLIESLESLTRRSLIEKEAKLFMLQPVIIEYVTTCLVIKVCQEIATQKPNLLCSHALYKATAKHYIQNIQKRMTLEPLYDRLCEVLGGKADIENHLFDILDSLQRTSSKKRQHAAGNIINFLAFLGKDFSGCDFSDLAILQADFRSTRLRDVNFQNTHFEKSLFAETFSGIFSVALSPDGRLLVTGDMDGNVCLRKLCSGEGHLWLSQEHSGWIPSIKFSPSGRLVASGSTDHKVKLWDVETGECLSTFDGHQNEVWAIAFSPDGKMVASGSDDYSVKLWEVCSGTCINTLVQPLSHAVAVAFSPDGKVLATGGSDHKIRLFSVKSNQCFDILDGHKGQVRSVAYSPDGTKLVSSSEDSCIKLWDLKTNKCLSTFCGHSHHTFSVCFDSTGRRLVSGSSDQTVKLWDVVSGKCLRTFSGHTDVVVSVAFSACDRLIVSGSRDQSVRTWCVEEDECVELLQGNSNQFNAVAFSADGQTVATGGQDRKLRLWSVETGNQVKVFDGNKGAIRTISFSSDGQTIATGSTDKLIKLWNTETAFPVRTLQGHKGSIQSVTFSPNGQILASGSDDASIRLWNVKTGKTIHVLNKHKAAIFSLAFSPCGTQLISGAFEESAILWDVDTGKEIRRLEGHKLWVWSVDWSSDGQLIASVSPDRTLRLWKTDGYECSAMLEEANGWLHAVSFSPNAQLIASSHQDFTIKLLKAQSLECSSVLKGHTGLTWSLAFSPDGKLLATGSEDETVRLWNVKTGECIRILSVPKPYENTNIQNVTGLSDSTMANVRMLGAC